MSILRFVIAIFLLFLKTNISAQKNLELIYVGALAEISSMLHNQTFDFQKAIYITENAYHQGLLNENEFNSVIPVYITICRELSQSGNIEYTENTKTLP